MRVVMVLLGLFALPSERARAQAQAAKTEEKRAHTSSPTTSGSAAGASARAKSPTPALSPRAATTRRPLRKFASIHAGKGTYSNDIVLVFTTIGCIEHLHWNCVSVGLDSASRLHARGRGGWPFETLG